jgi:Cu(I)/Ag(I) efflux system membrane fusion protein
MRVLVGVVYALLSVGLVLGGLWAWQEFMVRPEAAAEQAALSAPASGAAAGSAEGCEILYYRNPMGLPDISYEPKKDSMGMDYLPVCKEAAGGGIAISPERQQSLGVTFVIVERADLLRTIEAVGLVALDERTQSVIAPRVEGWIEELLVDATGDRVTRGMAIARVFSPELIQAQVNYRQAVQEGVARARGAAERLKLLGLSEEDIDRLAKGGEVAQTTLLTAPQDGVVVRKLATDGMFFSAGQTLLEIADLGRVWVMAEVYERDLALVTAGAAVEVVADAYPGRRFAGTVDSILPEIMQDTRTAQVRIELDNPEGLLRPGLFVRVRLQAVAAASALVVPRSAVLDSGRRQVALVALDEGHFEARDLKLGQAADGKVQVLEGLAEGERVVEAAAFLIDAESNIRAALQAFEPAASGSEGAKP